MDDNQIFIAYKGIDLEQEEILNTLKKYCPSDYDIHNFLIDFVTFAKINKKHSDINSLDPRFSSHILATSGYNCDELLEVCKNLEKVIQSLKKNIQINIIETIRYAKKHNNSDASLNHLNIIINQIYKVFGYNIFSLLSRYMHYCTVIYDDINNLFIAGLTIPNNKHTCLYYGYTKSNHEIVFSNSEEVLKRFCERVFKMENNTYMVNGIIYNFDNIANRENASEADKNIVICDQLRLQL